MATIILKAGKLVQAGTIIMQALSLIVTITETVTNRPKILAKQSEMMDPKKNSRAN